MTRKRLTRRRFVQAAAAVSAAPMFIPKSAFGANDKVQMGCIGMGWQGPGNIGQFLNLDGCKVVAACDVDKNHLNSAVNQINGKYKDNTAKGYADFRELLAREDIDAVMLALPDHWHGVVAVAAARAKKDIYGEKPLAHSFHEQQAIVKAVHENKRIWQTGSWQRSGFNFLWGAELARNAVCGKITRVEVGLPAGHADFNRTGSSGPDSDPPAELDYEFWTGPTKMIPYNKCRSHKNWRWNYNYGGGQLMDWIGHHNDIAHWGMGWDNSGPLEVRATGEFPPADAIWNTATKYRVECKYPGDVEVVIGGGQQGIAGGTKWIGEDGWVRVDRGHFSASNPEWTKKDFDRGPIKLVASNNHYQNFLDAIRSREPAIAHVDAAHRAATTGHLGQLAMETGKTIKWDAAKEQIVGDDELHKKLTHWEPRGDWKL